MSDQSKNSQVSLMSLYQVGAQRGNRKSRLNPRIKTSVFSVVNGLCMIDLVKTQNSVDICSDLLYKLGQKKKQVLLVGTSKHLQSKIEEYSLQFNEAPMPYVNSRWLGGTLSNWSTIKKTLKTLEKHQKIEDNKDFFSKLSKNEQLSIVRKKEKIMKFFNGLTNLKTSKPGALLIIDAGQNQIAISEAEKVGIPIIVLTNTSTSKLPKDLKYTIVCNINSAKAVDILVVKLIQAYNNGLLNTPQTKVLDQNTVV